MMSIPLSSILRPRVGYTQKDLTRFMRGAQRRERIFLEMALMPPSSMEIPQAKYQVTYMMFPSATWESKAKRYTRKGGTFTVYEKSVVMPYTGDPSVGGIPESWKVIMTKLVPPEHIPYRIRMNLATEMSKSTVDDQVPEVRDTHAASQDQAEEAAEQGERK